VVASCALTICLPSKRKRATDPPKSDCRFLITHKTRSALSVHQRSRFSSEIITDNTDQFRTKESASTRKRYSCLAYVENFGTRANLAQHFLACILRLGSTLVQHQSASLCFRVNRTKVQQYQQARQNHRNKIVKSSCNNHHPYRASSVIQSNRSCTFQLSEVTE
jgi:hypothetical protein